jgi:benzoate-CoA ligase
MKNIVKQILYNNQENDRVAVIDGDVEITFGQLRDRVSRATTYFQQVITKENPRVTICCQDSVEWLVAALGIMAAGGICTSVSIKLPQEHLAAKLKKIDPVLTMSSIGQLSNTTVDINSWFQSLDQYQTSDPVEVESNQPCMFNNSGGTTSIGKLLIHTHESYVPNRPNDIKYFMAAPGETSWALVPFTSSYGFGHATGCLTQGATLIIANTLNPNSIKDIIDKHRVSCIGGSPAMYSMILKHDCIPNHLPTVCCVGGDLLTRHFADRWHQKTGRPLRNIFGTSEYGLMFYTPSNRTVPADALGIPVEGLEIELRGDNGQLVPAGCAGQLWFRGPGLPIGIWNDSTNQAEAFCNGWVTTEDMLRQDVDGNYYFVGRKSETFKIDSKLIDLAKIENFSLESQLLDDALAVPVFDQNNRAHIKLLIVADSKESKLQHDLKQYLDSRLHKHEIPTVIQMVDELPRTPAGKKIRRPEYI